LPPLCNVFFSGEQRYKLESVTYRSRSENPQIRRHSDTQTRSILLTHSQHTRLRTFRRAGITCSCNSTLNDKQRSVEILGRPIPSTCLTKDIHK